ncbi:MAG: helix-turn-helix transcriptional regulator [Xanthomonadaceae bacterium]|nr:helix-turn-helix transcriptional regulator [Xanthomonadaceae bacterium]
MQWHIHSMHVIMHQMKSTSTSDPAQLVLRARTMLGLTQQEFGLRIGKSQGLVSKYEGGRVVPPARVVIHCVNVLNGSGPPKEADPKGWDAVHVALAQLQQALAEVTPTPRRSQSTI